MRIGRSASGSGQLVSSTAGRMTAGPGCTSWSAAIAAMIPGAPITQFRLSFSRSGARIRSRRPSKRSLRIASRTKPRASRPRGLSGLRTEPGIPRNSRCLTFSARDTVCWATAVSPEADDALACLSQLASSADELQRCVVRLTRLMSAPAGQAPGSYARTVPLSQRLRRLEAQALYAEGLTTEQLASVLGVSRQRTSALQRDGTQDLGS